MPSSQAFSRELSLPETPLVAILMCTYNGAQFLAQQLNSFEQQAYRNWSLHVSDDGSVDGTHAVLRTYAEVWGDHRLRVVGGPQAGFARNFLSLTCRADIVADYFAWSDQDDIWSAEKLQVAVDWLRNIPSEVPALYCGRTQIICEEGIPLGLSPNFSLPPHFKNALVQSIGGGNTMVFNQAARALIMEAGADLSVPSHDWWCYQLISGAGGVVHYDPQPRVFYRQHGKNVIGSNSDWCARLRRLAMVLQGRFYEWSAQNIRALESMSHRLNKDHRKTLKLFKVARKRRLPGRIACILKAGLHRQTLLGNLGLLLAILLKKI
ncbi:glycosyltransferase family 2 protein [Pseudomonas sp. NY15181]|uniref:glycosyltransferase family 2 protein n=1 Tax=Pseudomonas sp. NY15181 TaxID=3400349 RepID=UPI003A886AE6